MVQIFGIRRQEYHVCVSPFKEKFGFLWIPTILVRVRVGVYSLEVSSALFLAR
jgi:hypothetical protein